MKKLIIVSFLTTLIIILASFKPGSSTSDPMIERTFQDSIEADKLNIILTK
jgi:hypothetical protein